MPSDRSATTPSLRTVEDYFPGVPTPSVPVIDLGGRPGSGPSTDVVRQVADAAERFGFFQVVGHGIGAEWIDEVWSATAAFFEQPMAEKRRIMRTDANSRGYYDRELTKNVRDHKEVLDVAQTAHPDLPDDHPSNIHVVDGVNQWPDLVGFRSTMVRHMRACNDVALWLLAAFCEGLGEHADHLHREFGPGHTSFLRLNHYPVDDLLTPDESSAVAGLGDMALQHHTDSGALTVLLQDEVGGLQVALDDGWIDVEPIPGALVVNTGDMMQVWSNDRYRAAMHRVLPRSGVERSSLPYFFNPSYSTVYSPLPGSIAPGDTAHYRPINWGDFRRARADGDYADIGTEIQISHFAV
ncbi:MAG: 2OG-Fe(II) oxygenase family protein [Ilumatobacter sp.]|uniref:isopenicillin N synthase family dioxygenase n=1 Tax=Ilumatobacter sp. TaxID=1967498 RepID=UPI00329880BE